MDQARPVAVIVRRTLWYGRGKGRMQKIASGDETIHPWAEARRWLLVVPVALLPFLIALAALIIVKTVLSALGLPMFVLAYFLAAAASAFLSVTWSADIAPRR